MATQTRPFLALSGTRAKQAREEQRGETEQHEVTGRNMEEEWRGERGGTRPSWEDRKGLEVSPHLYHKKDCRSSGAQSAWLWGYPVALMVFCDHYTPPTTVFVAQAVRDHVSEGTLGSLPNEPQSANVWH